MERQNERRGYRSTHSGTCSAPAGCRRSSGRPRTRRRAPGCPSPWAGQCPSCCQLSLLPASLHFLHLGVAVGRDLKSLHGVGVVGSMEARLEVHCGPLKLYHPHQVTYHGYKRWAPPGYLTAKQRVGEPRPAMSGYYGGDHHQALQLNVPSPQHARTFQGARVYI